MTVSQQNNQNQLIVIGGGPSRWLEPSFYRMLKGMYSSPVFSYYLTGEAIFRVKNWLPTNLNQTQG
jgi:hypothetical protein